ncbi:hypothetical protein VNO78_07676 [Psophocarpus tetragonolobus]|uniref:WRKY domain-containing protein n=1 Tax=Psophocarpus tetragonolobus TaxID=3891 RepID=A0AAN9XS46_PSOTE
MEIGNSWEQKALVSELTQGMEIARKLKEDMSLPSSVNSRDSLLQRILSSYDKALLILRWNESMSNSLTMNQETNTSSPHFPILVDKSPLGEDAGGVHNSKKRKMMPKWTERVRVKIKNGVEVPLEDGHNWRKYGQKDILSAKYPRSYYRCTFRKRKGCLATKHVQRSEEDPTMLDITYRGSHTCKENDGVVAPKSADNDEKIHSNNIEFEHAQILSAKTDNITAHPFGASSSTSFGCMTQDDNYHALLPSLVLNNDPCLATLSQTSLLSPNTPQSVSPSFLLHEFDGFCNKPCPESHFAEIVSSTTNSPIFDFSFSLDAVGIDESFPFNASGFYPECTSE